MKWLSIFILALLLSPAFAGETPPQVDGKCKETCAPNETEQGTVPDCSKEQKGCVQKQDTKNTGMEKDALRFAPRSMKLKTPLPLSPVKPEVINNGSRDEKKIALTFDACSTNQKNHYDDRITEVLVKTGTPATIFLGGKWMEEEPEHTRYLASMTQFELAGHAFFHPHLINLSDERIREELELTQKVMFTLTGRQPLLFRPPYGEYDERVVQIAAELGLITVGYDLPSGDPDVNATKEKLIAHVTNKAKNGSIIVMHINRHGWHTAEALPEIITILRKKGFELVTVGELIEALRR